MDGAVGQVAAYQFGWTRDGSPHRRHGGKNVRAALALTCARAVGGDPQRAVPAAVAVEMVHNLSLLYDDVLDGDALRRHRASAWEVFGPGAATRSADALLMLAFEVLAGPDGEAVAGEASAALLDTLIQLAVGESLDVLFEAAPRIELSECLEMVSGKTASLISCACRLGALHGGAGPAQVETLAAFGHDLGMAFQLVDDLLGIWGDEAVTGKPVFADLRARKLSVPVVAAMASNTAAGEELARRYALPADPGRVGEAELARLVEEAGGRRWTVDRAAEHADGARRRLRSLADGPGAVPGAVADLDALCELIVNRSY
ncbi:polyprenyl synthetase family protein [Kitasatospora sp. NBC_01300]|uniref:polyprenyl synthetase family protein n=1 Tax=Kitasatospora sp. NBC_01300 TaxID=2903574 RepID=UPI002F9146EF|nr:polyprenyl synthetase family protein [Kitasatospora sp. NBC_01300]